jgi:hypothetical protein
MESRKMSKNNIPTKARIPYIKPRVEQVRLVLDESVLAICKTELTGGGWRLDVLNCAEFQVCKHVNGS